jgi:hypothetical protein
MSQLSIGESNSLGASRLIQGRWTFTLRSIIIINSILAAFNNMLRDRSLCSVSTSVWAQPSGGDQGTAARLQAPPGGWGRVTECIPELKCQLRASHRKQSKLQPAERSSSLVSPCGEGR